MLKTLGLSEGESIQHSWITKALERAQKKVEGRNFDVRKTLLKFDDVLNDQRKNIFDQRLIYSGKLEKLHSFGILVLILNAFSIVINLVEISWTYS